MNSQIDLRSALAHVLWIGGAIGAGKTSGARLLAEKHGLGLYHSDRSHSDHYRRMHPQRHLTMTAFAAMTQDERWVLRPGSVLAPEMLAWHTERFEMVVEDLRSLPREQRVSAEGFGLLPSLVQPLLLSPHQAIWLISTRAFRRHALILRGVELDRPDWPGTSDPVRAQRNKDDRDQLLAEATAQEARALHLAVLEVDGTLGLGKVAARIEQHLSPILAPSTSEGDRR